MKLTAERLRQLLRYDPDTGEFRWLHTDGPKARNKGVCGSICKRTGYRKITIDASGYLAHRLAWLYMTGTWPEKLIDHKNKERSDNRWENLRQVTNVENLQNRRLESWRSASGRLGVSTSEVNYSGNMKYKASIVVDGKVIYIGRFETPQEAAAAYLGAKRMAHRGFIP